MKNFEIDEAHLCSVTVYENYHPVKDKDNPTAEELIDILIRDRHWTLMSSKDHPAFEELREELGCKKYIKIQRCWWNGDIVLKSFRLNGYLFKTNERFPCGSAMKGCLKFEKKNSKKK